MLVQKYKMELEKKIEKAEISAGNVIGGKVFQHNKTEKPIGFISDYENGLVTITMYQAEKIPADLFIDKRMIFIAEKLTVKELNADIEKARKLREEYEKTKLDTPEYAPVEDPGRN